MVELIKKAFGPHDVKISKKNGLSRIDTNWCKSKDKKVGGESGEKRIPKGAARSNGDGPTTKESVG